MTLSIQISGETSNGVFVAMRVFQTGRHDDKPEITALHRKICDALEPAVYEGLKSCINKGLIKDAYLQWDAQQLHLKTG